MHARHRHRKPPARTWQRTAAGALYTLTCVVVFAVVGIGVGIGAHRLRVEAIESNSMRPVFARGTAVFLTPEHIDQVRVGQIISYVPPQPFPQVNVVHRVYSVKRISPTAIEIQTKGDANKAPDPWQTVISGGVWHLKAAVPYLGQLPLLFGNPIALIGIILVILSVIVVVLIPAKDDEERAPTPVVAWVQPAPVLVPASVPALAYAQPVPWSVPELVIAAPLVPAAMTPVAPPVAAWPEPSDPDVADDGPVSIFSLLGQ